MLLSSLSSSFIFNFPSDFLPAEVLSDYDGFLEAYHMPYDTIIDYLNSTIKSVSFPGLSITLNEQHKLRGKWIGYKPAKPVQDIVATHELNVIFRSVDGDMNYLLCYDIFQKHYLDTENMYIKPFTVTSLDMYRNGVWQVKYYQLVAVSLSENIFDYSAQKVNAKEFTMTFSFNYIELEDLFNKSKIIDMGNKSALGNNLPLILRR
jgi:hypothetical protein